MLRQIFLALLPALSLAKLITWRNDVSRLDTDGRVIDCHSGNIVAVNNTFYLFGERYDNRTGIGPSPPMDRPHLVVYTSPDLTTWTNHNDIFSTWPNFPSGTF
jgi:hypothetical protein